MPTDFDRRIDRRRAANINKWTYYPGDVLPLWVADMDFQSPPAVRQALRSKLKDGVLGYELPGHRLLERVAARLESRNGWRVSPEMIVVVPSVNVGYRLAAQVASQPGQGILIQPPVYHHFIEFPTAYGRVRQDNPLRRADNGRVVQYELDLETLASAFHKDEAPTAMILLCNPHNPVGRPFTRDELLTIVARCNEQGVVLCSDDIHSELLLGGAAYTPAASLDPSIADNSITFTGPGKSFNLSGLGCAFAVIPGETLRRAFHAEVERQAQEANSLGLAAAAAAYSGECDAWQVELLAYLAANRDFLLAYLESELPELRSTRPSATYLAWIDCRACQESGQINGLPGKFFLEQARVALSEGAEFGPGGEGFVRLNFATRRAVLEQALERMRKALIH